MTFINISRIFETYFFANFELEIKLLDCRGANLVCDVERIKAERRTFEFTVHHITRSHKLFGFANDIAEVSWGLLKVTLRGTGSPKQKKILKL